MSCMATRSARRRAVGAAAALLCAGLAAPAAAQEAEVTWAKDIAPILQRSCQQCHRPDGGAPMSLLTYEDTRPWARSIRQRTGLRHTQDAMPPWYIEKEIGIQDYKGDVSLSDAEVAAIAQWVDRGAPRGNPADAPPPLEFADASVWTIGEPDLIISSPSVEIGAADPDWWGPIGQTPVEGLAEDRYVAAIEMKEINDVEPSGGRETVGSRWGIHHLVWNVVHPEQYTPEELEALRQSDPNQYARVVSSTTNEQGFWPVHEVGRNADYFDPKAGLLLQAGSNVIFSSAHLHSTGTHMTSRLDIGFKFHPRDYEPEYRNRLLAYGTGELDIRGGTANQKIETFQTLPYHAKMTIFEPHLHAAGTRMCLDAIYPTTGAMETLSCAGYNHSWVRAYPYADHAAPLLPKGTILRITGYFDTSPGNRNVADPRNWAGMGDRSIDNMLINLAQGVELSDEQYAAEVEQRRRDLDLAIGEYVVGCPACGGPGHAAAQNQQ